MKKSLLTVTFLILVLNAFSQKEEIDLKSPLKKLTKTVNAGIYNFSIKNINLNNKYHITTTSDDIELEELKYPSGTLKPLEGLKTPDSIKIGPFKLEKQQQLVISIDILEKKIDPATKTETFVKIDNYTYTYKTKSRGKWQTTVGFNFIYKTNQDTYYSKSDGSTYVITEANNRDKFDFHPTIMFTWFSNDYIGKKNMNWKFGLSGGLGYDFDESLSVFLGPSWIYNQNITLTIGGAFHKQKRLTSNYSAGDVINENLTFEQLHSDYIRVNPFVSISFRLDKDPFKKL